MTLNVRPTGVIMMTWMFLTLCYDFRDISRVPLCLDVFRNISRLSSCDRDGVGCEGRSYETMVLGAGTNREYMSPAIDKLTLS